MQTLPSGVSDLLSFAEHVANGLEMHGPWLGVTQLPSSDFRRILSEAGQAEAARSAAENAKAYSQARVASANEELTAWLRKARLVVMLARGERWSKGWIDTGFTYRAANVPKRIDMRIGLARRFVNFLALHPEYGVPFAGVTAVRGRSVYERVIQARDALDLAITDWVMKKRLRDTAKRGLQHAIRQVIKTLDSIIPPSDPHFGEVLTEPKPIPLLSETHSDPECTVAA
jgi:hypothetical protein